MFATDFQYRIPNFLECQDKLLTGKWKCESYNQKTGTAESYICFKKSMRIISTRLEKMADVNICFQIQKLCEHNISNNVAILRDEGKLNMIRSDI